MKQVRIQNDVIELSPNRQELINISRPIFHSSVTLTSNLERDFEDLDRVTRDCSEVLKTSLSLNRLPTKDEIFIAEIDKKPSRCIVTKYLSENSVKALAIDYEKTATLFINRIYQSQDVCQTPSLMTKMRIQYSEPSFNANIGINEIQSIVAKYESFRIDPIGFDSKNELYCHLFGLQGSQWRNIGAELEKNCLVSKLTKHPVLTTEGLSALKMSVEISSSQQISDLNHSNISEGEFLSVQITHLSEKYLRNGELLIHCRNTEMNEEFESVQARMRFFYETEKERIRSDALTDFTDIDYVMFVVKGPLCLRGKVLDFEEGENLHVKAIDFGFEMKVKKKNCFKLEEEFGSIPAMAILVQAMGLELCKDNKEVIKEEINALKKAATEVSTLIDFINFVNQYFYYSASMSNFDCSRSFQSSYPCAQRLPNPPWNQFIVSVLKL